jgi:hypothetical protein
VTGAGALSGVRVLTLHPVSRDTEATHLVWFPLDHQYVERCWTSVIGPTGVMLLRRAASLFSESASPTVDLRELGRDLGLYGLDGHRRIEGTLHRLVRLGFISVATSSDVDVFVDVPPLRNRDLRRATPAVRAVHHRLVRERVATGLNIALDGSKR